MLSYIDDEQYRRRILTQLNRGEGRHSVARTVFHLTFRTLFYTAAAIFAEPPVERRVGAISRPF